jgi:hypothetical protein
MILGIRHGQVPTSMELVELNSPSIGKTKIDFRENGHAGFVAVTQREQNLSGA